MSGYMGRSGPNFSEYLNNLNSLNTVSPPYDEASQFNGDLMDFNSDLSMFTNTNFTPDDPFNFDMTADPQDGLYDEITSNPVPPKSLNGVRVQSPTNSSHFNYNYNTPIQPAPPNHFPPTQSVQSPGQQGQRKKVEAASPSQNVEEKSRLAAEEDKRRRNTAASARFRVKKKQREQALEKMVKEVQDKNAKLEAKNAQLEMENKWLKELITEKHSIQSKEEIAAAYQKYRKESEDPDVKESPVHATGVGTD